MTFAVKHRDPIASTIVDKRMIWCIGILAAVAATQLGGMKLLNDADIYWHVGVGNWIIDHRAVPRLDSFSMTALGKTWIAQEWLSEVISAAAYDAFGWRGVIALAAAALGISLAILGATLSKWLRPLHVLIATMISFAIFMPHLLARPHLFVMPFIVTFVGGLVVARHDRRAPSIWLLSVVPFWANMHGSFPLAVALVGFFAGETLIEERTWTSVRAFLTFTQDDWSKSRPWLWLLLGTIASGCIGPYGIDAYITLIKLARMPYAQSVLVEWRPLTFSGFQLFEVWLLGLFGALIYAGVRLPATRLLFLFGIIHLTLHHVRGEDYVAFIAPLIIAPAIASHLYSNVPPERGFLSVPLIAPIMLAAIAISSLAVIPKTRGDAITPAGAVAAAQKANLRGPVFNAYDFGGYLIFEGIPTFIDGRAEMYGDDFLKTFFQANSGNKELLITLLSKYDVQWTLLEPSSSANAVLSTLPGWSKFYGDERAVIFVHHDFGAM
jgi:hypothetical protein